jgi:hypothetical protein
MEFQMGLQRDIFLISFRDFRGLSGKIHSGQGLLMARPNQIVATSTHTETLVTDVGTVRTQR